MSEGSVVVRAARSSDMERVAALAEELGYPQPLDRFRTRYQRYLEESAAHLVVATVASEVIGWLALSVRESLLSGRYAEIDGLVVGATHRRSGAGRALIAWAEGEARRQGLPRVRLFSNSLRVEAVSFYPALGYRQVKLSRVFEKEMTPAETTHST